MEGEVCFTFAVGFDYGEGMSRQMQKRRFLKAAFPLFFLLVFCPTLAGAEEKGDLCEEIILQGHVEWPEGREPQWPVELYLSYQMNYQKDPAFLLISYPLQEKDFSITLAPYRALKKHTKRLPKNSTKPPTESHPETKPESQPETKPETKPESQPETKPESQPESGPMVMSQKFLAPAMFLYPREIQFQYYAMTPDGLSRSAYYQTSYTHEKKEIDGKLQCQPEVILTPIVLK
jgi:hypothetical protein